MAFVFSTFNESLIFMDTHTFIAFFAYFLVLLTIGLLAYRKQTSDSDFIVGNRSLNFWVIALSAHASDMSSWLFMAFPAAIMIRGLSQSWIAFGLLLGMFFNWQFVAKRLRRATEELNSYTLSTFFERRFKDNSGIIRILTAFMQILFLSCYLAAGLVGMGMLFESIFGINYYLGLSVATGVVVIYTFVGGFVTVAWTDLFQALFLMIMIIIVPVVAYHTFPNGVQSIIASAEAQQVSFSFLHSYSVESILTALFLVFGWGLGYFGQPHIVTKFLGIKKASELTKSKYLGMSWMVLALAGAAAVGLIGIPFFEGSLQKPELVFVEMVKTLFNPLVSGFILCGLVAACMSTMDSQILVCASVLSEDVYKNLFNRKASPKKLLLISRLGVIIISAVALAVAFMHSSSILETVQYAWSGLGCAFGPLVLTALYSKKANKNGAIAGIFVGGVIAAFWDKVNFFLTSYAVPSMIPGFLLSLLSIHIVSRLFPERGAVTD